MVEVTKTSAKAQVSSLGRFKSPDGVISTPIPTESGYVGVRINGESHALDQLIATAFGLPKQDDEDTVEHIDNDPSNNRVENLRWVNRNKQEKRHGNDALCHT